MRLAVPSKKKIRLQELFPKTGAYLIFCVVVVVEISVVISPNYKVTLIVNLKTYFSHVQPKIYLKINSPA